MITAAPRDDGVEIAVADSGIGIAPDMLGRIFEPFRQGDHGGGPPRWRRPGPAHRAALLTALGGSIEVESEPQRGSTFRLWVPSQLHGPRHEPRRRCRGARHRQQRREPGSCAAAGIL
jgi:signal transduction histidine kinase